jgi:hypothetical protein
VSGYDVAGDLAEELKCIFNDNFGYSMFQHKYV